MVKQMELKYSKDLTLESDKGIILYSKKSRMHSINEDGK